MTNESPDNESPDNDAPLSVLETHFGDSAPIAQRIVDLIEATPDRIWRAADLISEADIGPGAGGYMLLSRLTTIGAIAHPDLGRYSAAVKSPAQSRIA